MKKNEVAARLRELATEHNLPELEELAAQLKNRPPVRKAPTASVTVTPRLARRIRKYVQEHPDETYMQIAGRFKVNHGRVSEIMVGKRT